MRTILRVVLWCALAVTVGFAVLYVHSTYVASMASKADEEATVRAMSLVPRATKHLGSQFSDKRDRLLADPPSSPDQFVDPQTIVVAHIVTSDADSPVIAWSQFESHLATVTGRKVIDRPYENSPDDLSQIQSGTTTIVALHAAETPFLVNNYGFQPVAVLGNNGGAEGNHMDIIVPSDSPISKTADLRGHHLVCTVPSSITGYRAAIALLAHNDNLRPNVDYDVNWSVKQKHSILGIAKQTLEIGTDANPKGAKSIPVHFEAAAVSDDKLQTMIKHGDVSASEFRIIFKSEVIPRTTIGYFFNLRPELASKITDAILSYRPDNGAAEVSDSESSPSKSLRFIAVDYKKDFNLVREVDDSFDPRLGAKSPKHASTEPATLP